MFSADCDAYRYRYCLVCLGRGVGCSQASPSYHPMLVPALMLGRCHFFVFVCFLLTFWLRLDSRGREAVGGLGLGYGALVPVLEAEW